MSPALYRVRDRKGTHVFHHDKLKLCEDRQIPLWVRRKRHELLHLDETIGYDEAEQDKTPVLTTTTTSASTDTDTFQQQMPVNVAPKDKQPEKRKPYLITTLSDGSKQREIQGKQNQALKDPKRKEQTGSNIIDPHPGLILTFK